MANHFMHYTCCLIVLSSCVNQGDGRWKKRDQEKLHQDMDLFKKMAEKIEHEIEAFYGDYSDEQITEDGAAKIDGENLKNTLDRKPDANKKIASRKVTLQSHARVGNITDHISVSSDEATQSSDVESTHTPIEDTSELTNGFRAANSEWPKFEDILLAMGKKYDWKNDRWIKVKKKLKVLKEVKVEDNSIGFHEKHKFSYRLVKLNRKSRRNVVIAVSAVR